MALVSPEYSQIRSKLMIILVRLDLKGCTSWLILINHVLFKHVAFIFLLEWGFHYSFLQVYSEKMWHFIGICLISCMIFGTWCLSEMKGWKIAGESVFCSANTESTREFPDIFLCRLHHLTLLEQIALPVLKYLTSWIFTAHLNDVWAVLKLTFCFSWMLNGFLWLLMYEEHLLA